ncbi:MAG: peptide chain release factor N(5)-glutamine methyltransferase [Candidatus Omnitrophota bacterium]
MNEAELLFTEVIHCSRQELYNRQYKALDKRQKEFITRALKRRLSGEPIQYILGKADFMGLVFKVNPRVLIPRPETEILVETTVKYARKAAPHKGKMNILDIGTGCGNIAISLAKFLPEALVIGLDISKSALAVAKSNAALNNVSNRIHFVCSDLFISTRAPAFLYDIIISNPPYIPGAEMKNLQVEVRHEPGSALNGGEDGLEFYRRIISGSPDWLKENGILALEMGFGQCQSIKGIFAKSGKFDIIDIVKDYSGIERVLIAKKRA